jgi:hypothetical protein
MGSRGGELLYFCLPGLRVIGIDTGKELEAWE